MRAYTLKFYFASLSLPDVTVSPICSDAKCLSIPMLRPHSHLKIHPRHIGSSLHLFSRLRRRCRTIHEPTNLSVILENFEPMLHNMCRCVGIRTAYNGIDS